MVLRGNLGILENILPFKVTDTTAVARKGINFSTDGNLGITIYSGGSDGF